MNISRSARFLQVEGDARWRVWPAWCLCYGAPSKRTC